jgi:DNA polymerase III epsilon subunit-like protein
MLIHATCGRAGEMGAVQEPHRDIEDAVIGRKLYLYAHSPITCSPTVIVEQEQTRIRRKRATKAALEHYHGCAILCQSYAIPL